MLEEVEKVTSDKLKNPGRQEWGRKLGKMQKELKAKKLNTVLKQEEQGPSTASLNSAWNHNILKWEYATAVVGIIVGVAAFYYQKKSYEDTRSSLSQSPLSTIPVHQTMNKPSTFSDF